MNWNDDLIQRIKNGPRILFLGQKYLEIDNNENPMLKAIKQKFFNDDTSIENYNLFLRLSEVNNMELDLTLGWIQKRCERISAPEWLNAISNIYWNSIYTSSVDNVISKCFRNSWRTFKPIINNRIYPNDLRSITNLHGTFLFGNVSRITKSERPPLDEFELLEARDQAKELLKRLPSLITPFGVLIIEGYDFNNDWIKIEDLYPLINSLNRNQVHLFNCDINNISSNIFANKLIETDKLVIHKEGFSDFLLEAERKGIFNYDTLIAYDEQLELKRVTINKKRVNIPKNLYNDIIYSAIVLDDSINLPIDDLPHFKIIDEFKNFLLESSVRPIWDGYKRKFNICRTFEHILYNLIKDQLKQTFESDLIILYGQAGSGKTVSLGKVAYKLKCEEIAPILFIEKKNQKPDFEIIDRYCKWVEDSGAEKTIIFWDDSVNADQISQYNDLKHYLVTRGRKVVIIGSSYRVQDTNQNKDIKYTESKVNLDENEIKSFKAVLNRVYEEVPNNIDLETFSKDSNFLVLLYRLLPDTKTPLRKGINDETQENEKVLTNLMKMDGNEQHCNILAELLIAKLKEINFNFTDNAMVKDKYDYEESIDIQIQRITELIVVPGQFGLSVPIELILRIINKGFNEKIVKLFEKLDVFRITQRRNGNLEISPRHQVEAKLLVQYRIGSYQKQIDIIKELIENVKNSTAYGEDNEISFIVELLKNIGPNGKENSRGFMSFYMDIAKSLEIAREKYGVVNSRLMLQEAAFMREYVQQNNKSSMDLSEKIKTMENAEKIIKSAISIEEHTSNRKFKGFLYNELATNLGVRLREYINNNYKKKYLLNIASELQRAFNMTRKLDPDTYYPVDVLGWSSISLVDSKTLGESEKEEILANALSVFERVESENTSVKDRKDFIKRKLELSNKCKNSELSNQTFNKLLDMGSGAGIYLMCRQRLINIDMSKEINLSEVETCKSTIKYLKEFDEIINKDSRCLYLLLQLIWLVKSRKPIFYNEKQTLPFDKFCWQEINNIARKIIELDGEYANVPIRYIEALSYFHLGDFRRCIEVYKEIRNDEIYGRRRVIASHLASNEDGTIKVYSGTVESYKEETKSGRIYIDAPEIRSELFFSGKEFTSKETILHTTHEGLNIAFNFVSPYVIKGWGNK
ncbi:hypothetical protein [Clostridium coskatii]|uniref:Novel STAND NTPase 5 domain-containing protein n=1 Tax=Clostridium coskatii TaxID=1705578 RepID=A0A166U3W7_9CLOT|nr:hypothetical protein [Clostridium coskatii]OAA94539.1 hypothetical protein WX73_03085 [Clostridium coskatii]OBR93283.1 hypothetical protein CLCOS_27550 [Clostridium coskatii]